MTKCHSCAWIWSKSYRVNNETPIQWWCSKLWRDKDHKHLSINHHPSNFKKLLHLLSSSFSEGKLAQGRQHHKHLFQTIIIPRAFKSLLHFRSFNNFFLGQVFLLKSIDLMNPILALLVCTCSEETIFATLPSKCV